MNAGLFNDFTSFARVKVRKNFIETNDDPFQLFSSHEWQGFYDTTKGKMDLLTALDFSMFGQT